MIRSLHRKLSFLNKTLYLERDFHPKTLSFNRLVIGLCFNNTNFAFTNQLFFKNSNFLKNLPSYQQREIEIDAKNFADKYIKENISLGCYTPSAGFNSLRLNLAKKLELRDSIKYNFNDFLASDGVTGGLMKITNIIYHDNKDVVLIPNIDKGYYKKIIEFKKRNFDFYNYCNQDNTNVIDLINLQNQINNIKKNKKNPKAIIISNPSNPTGKIMKKEEIAKLIELAFNNNILLIVDESLQDNVVNDKFISFSKILNKLKPEISKNQELISIFSLSHSYFNNSGNKAGFIQLTNIDPLVTEQINKLFNLTLNSNVTGQILLDLWANPPSFKNSSQATIDFINNEKISFFKNEKLKLEKINNKIKNSKLLESKKIECSPYAFIKLKVSNSFKNFNLIESLKNEKKLRVFDGNKLMNQELEDDENNYIRINIQNGVDGILEGLTRIEDFLGN